MSDDIEPRLEAAAQAVRELEVTRRRCDDLRARQHDLSAEAESRRAECHVEEHEVERLEHLSLARVLASLKGSREEAMERERAEAAAARYRAADAQARLDSVTRELESAGQRLAQLAQAPDQYAAILAEKERLLTESGDPRRAALLSLADERGRLTAEVSEMGSAVRDAEAAKRALQRVQDTLASARSWNTYDTYFGGGFLADIKEHDRLDQAAQEAHEADRRMAALRTELAELDHTTETSPLIAISGATRFVDMWFGNIFTDLAIRDRISQGQQNVEHSLQVVKGVQQRLAARMTQAQARLTQIEADRRDLLTQR